MRMRMRISAKRDLKKSVREKGGVRKKERKKENEFLFFLGVWERERERKRVGGTSSACYTC